MLKPLTPTGKTEPSIPIRTCEACGTQKRSDESINCIIVIGSPGHASLAPFQCAQEEHWACSPECWRSVAHACIDEHMHVLLLAHHTSLMEK